MGVFVNIAEIVGISVIDNVILGVAVWELEYVEDDVILGVLVWELEYVEDTVNSGVLVRIVEELDEVDGVVLKDDAVVGDELGVV